MTTIKTATRVVTLSLIDRATGMDWSGDYVGNHHDRDLRRDPGGAYDYLASDDAASWWERQCESQQEADDALAELSSEQRAAIRADPRLAVDLEDQPAAILAVIAEVVEASR